MNPLDAESRGIRDGEKVIVSNHQGRVKVVARLTEDISRGVVSLDEGIWPVIDKNGEDSSGSANMLTPTEPTMPSQGSRTHSLAVEVISTMRESAAK